VFVFNVVLKQAHVKHRGVVTLGSRYGILSGMCVVGDGIETRVRVGSKVYK